MARAINDGNFAKNQVTAYFLAQEGLEIIINKRNLNLKEIIEGSSIDWLQDLDNCRDGCKVSPDEDDFDQCYFDTGTCRLNISGDLYTHNAGVPSLFSRQIRIENIEGGSGRVRVTADVRWKNKEREVSFDISTIILNQAPLAPTK